MRLFLLVIAFGCLFGGCAGVAPADRGFKPLGSQRLPAMISGTRQAGTNTTEPAPQSSKYLAVRRAGIGVIPEGATYFVIADVRQAPPKPMYIRIFYEDPAGGPPLTNDQVFNPSDKSFGFSSPRTVTGLVGYRDYEVRIEVYENRDSSEPVDVLTQKLRSYVDNTGNELLVWSGLRLAN